MLVNANALHIPLANKSVQCVVTSPPYWGLRDYGISDQLGLEPTPEEYVENMVKVFQEVKRVLRDDGTLWLNLGDSYATSHPVGTKDDDTGWKHGEISTGLIARAGSGGLKPKNLIGIPWRVAFALQADGWYLRNDIIWHKPNPMPESVKDRCTKSHEYIFLLTKNKKYYYDNEAIKEDAIYAGILVSASNDKAKNAQKGKYGATAIGFTQHDTLVGKGRNKRTVWTITTKPYSGAHYAVFPPELPEICIKAGSAEGDIVFDPFAGSGTTVMVARKLRRRGIGLDLSFDYLNINAKERLGMKALEEWESGKIVSDNNVDDLPMWGGHPQKDHKNMHRNNPHSFHKERLNET